MPILWGCSQEAKQPDRPYRYEAQFSEVALRGWEIFPRSGGRAHDNVLTMTGGISIDEVTSGYPGGMESLSNARIEVDTRWQEGTDTSPYGVVCRWTNQGDYRFVIKGDGSFAMLQEKGIAQTRQPSVEPLHDWTLHKAIRPKGKNHVQVLLKGAQLTFIINNTPVATVEDTTLVKGVAGLVVEGNQRVDFTSFIVEELR